MLPFTVLNGHFRRGAGIDDANVSGAQPYWGPEVIEYKYLKNRLVARTYTHHGCLYV